ncbi:MAG: hypothetical protein HC818_01230 [Synechococcaceae cyanobacterium RM1_1_27]|nr:hypothetical protein [Synechococcaceae cyanobacterium SM2_3_2]NJO85477.1 hypothetical protein [Synechococcaceae cyanobacterium RM1_1_27]
MTDDERFDRLAGAIERVAVVSAESISNLSRRLEESQLRFQEQLGDMAGIVRQVVQQQAVLQQQQESLQHQQEALQRQQEALQRQQEALQRQQETLQQQQEGIRQRQAEQDQRFDVLLQELRFIARRLPPEEGSTNGT